MLHRLTTFIVCMVGGAALAPLPVEATAQQEIPLYEGAADSPDAGWPAEEMRSAPGGYALANVSRPRIEVHLAPQALRNGTSIIYLPGGGMRMLMMGRDEQELIATLNAEGISVFVLKYRTLPIEKNAAGKPPPASSAAVAFQRFPISKGNANPAPTDERLAAAINLSIADAQTAIEIIRHRAHDWGLRTDRIGMMGTSAGGGATMGAVIADAPGRSPDFVVLNFGPALTDVVVPESAPPLFMVTETNHGPVTDGLVALFDIWRSAGKRAELHVLDVPTFRMAPSLWLPRFLQWLGERGMVAPRKHTPTGEDK